MHPMSFSWGTDIGVFMFPGLTISGVGQLIGLCVVLFIFALIFEAVKIIQTKSRSRAAREILHENSCPASRLINDEENESQSRIRKKNEFSGRILRTLSQTSVFLFQTTLGYLMMLSVMVYNGYVFIIVILGYAIGYFFFGHIAMKINMENVRARKTHVICKPNCSSEPTTSRFDTLQNKQEDSSNQQKRKCGDNGYSNELGFCSSSSSLSTSLTQTTQIDKEIDIHARGDIDDDNNSNIVQSCRL